MNDTLVVNPLGIRVPEASELRSRIRLWDFAAVALQLGLVLLLLRQFQIESAAFRLLAMLAFAGFAIHAFLPLPARLPFFSALSLISIPLTLGLVNGAWLVEWDDHPNTLGHRLVADALYRALAANPAALFGAGAAAR